MDSISTPGDGHAGKQEAVLLQGQAYFQRLLEKLPVGAYMCDPDGLITYFNRHAVRLWGREPKLNDPVDRFCGSFKLFSADGAPISHDQCWMALALKNNQVYDGQEILVKRPQGEVLNVLAHANPIHDEYGNVMGAVNVLVDVSEQRRVAEERHRNEARFRTAVEGSLNAFFILRADRDAAGRIVDFVFEDLNTPGEQLIGIPRRQALGGRLLDLLPANRELGFFDKYCRVVETRESLVEEFGKCAGGHVGAWFWQQVVPLEDGIAITTADLTERKRAEAELEDQLRQMTFVHELSAKVTQAPNLDALYEIALDAILDATGGDRGALLLFDDAAVMRFKAWRGLSDGYRAAVEGHSPWRPEQADATIVAVPDVAADASLSGLQDVLLQENIHALAFIPLAYEGRLLGKFMLYERRARAFPEAELRFVQTIANHVAFAIERKQAEAALCASEERYRTLSATLEQRVEERTRELGRANELLGQRNRELQDFAQAASHDLQEPLRKFRTFLGLLRSDMQGASETVMDYVRRMDTSAERMSELITALLALSRVATRGERFRETELGQVIEEVLLDLEVSVKEAEARIEIGPVCTVEADPAQIRQLFQNLIGNALKFRRPGVPSVVHISMETGGVMGDGEPSCRITVADNGIGFEEKYLDRIFSPFQRLHGRGAYAGTGMGLAICRRIAERHCGTITAHSTPGEGSRFVVTLPLRQSFAVTA